MDAPLALISNEEWNKVFDETPASVTTESAPQVMVGSAEAQQGRVESAPQSSSDAADAEETDGGDAQALFSSSVVQLPETVPGLVKAYERLHVRCEGMRALLDSLRLQANRLAASSPSAGAALSDLLHVVVDGETAPAVAPDGTLQTSTQRHLDAPAKATAGSSPAPTPPPHAAAGTRGGSPSTAATGGAVITGKVLSSPAKNSPIVMGSSVVAGDGAGTRRRLTRFGEDFKRDYKEECNVLKTQMIAMEAAQQLLAVARGQLHEAEKEKREQQRELKRLRVELKEIRKGTGGEEAAGESITPLKRSMRDLEVARDAAQYRAVQLEKSNAEAEKALAFLNEKNAQLEGQLQRLLTAPPQMAPAPPPSSLNTPQRPPEDSRQQQQQQQQVVSAEAYHRAASERQIIELRAMVDKLQRHAEANVAKRKQLEGAVAVLTKENNELKGSVVQYRRQLNESELDLEREASAKAVEERAKHLEKEVLRLRHALRERKEAFDAKKDELLGVAEGLRRENKVFQVSVAHLQKELLRCQLRLVIHTQRAAQDKVGSLTRGAGEEALPCHRHGAENQRAEMASLSSVTGVGTPALMAVSAASAPGAAHAPPTGAQDVPSDPAAAPSSPAGATTDAAASGSHGLNASFGSPQLQHSREALEEMRHLYERRMETLEAQRRAEVRRVENLNKELRHALASSQEEVLEKNRLLDLARAQSTAGGIAGGSGAIYSRHGLSGSTLPVPVSMPADTVGSADASPSMTPAGANRLRSAPSSWNGQGPMETCHQRLFSTDSSAALDASGKRYAAAGSGRSLADIEQQYDPENMSVWEAVQVENEALLQRVSALQEEKWAADSVIEDMQRQITVQQRELHRNASTMNQLVKAGVVSPAAVQRGQEEGRIRSLQCLLQDTLAQKMALEEEVTRLTERLRRFQA